MRNAALFGLLALVPAAVNASQVASPATQLATALICSGDGTAANVVHPLGGDGPARDGNQPCCAKGCHSGNPRKRFVRDN